MPFVARRMPLLHSVVAVNQFARTMLLTAACVVCTHGFAQEAAAPAEPEPAPATENAAAPAAAAPQAGGCEAEIIAQRKLTRTIREIRNPLPRPSKADFDKIKRTYPQLLATGFSSPSETKVIQDALSFTILQATDPEFSHSTRNMQNLLDDVKDDVAKAGSGIGNPANQAAARKKFCAEVLKVTKPLLDNNLDSRLAAVKIMQSLYDVMGVQNGPKPRLHGDALLTLLTVLNDPQQPDSVKVTTASSIRNVLMNCDVVEQDQFRICDAVAKELARPCTEAAFQMVLVDSIYEISKPRRTVGAPEPTAMKIMAAVLNDRSKPVEVRCHAARGVGRCVFDPQMKLDPLAWKIAQLAGDAALEFNKNPGEAKWAECGLDLMLAFRHNTAAEATAPVLDRKGLMNRDPKSSVISGAAPFIMTVSFKLLANNSQFNLPELAPLAQWIKANQPTNLTWDANAPPLTP